MCRHVTVTVNTNTNSTEPQKIACNDHKLCRIPLDIPKSAMFLDLSWNNIYLIRQNDFSELQTLDLGNNHISHVEDAAFSHLSCLTALSLNDNRLTNLTEHMFTGLSNLSALNLRDNQIKSISESAFVPLTRLQVLFLSANALSSIKSITNIVSFYRSLKTLSLSANPLTSFESEQFSFPCNITDLHLRKMSLLRFALHSDVFPHLQTLLLTALYTDLQWDVSDKAFLKALRRLDLSFTHFSDETYQLIFQRRIRNMTRLTELLLESDRGTLVEEGGFDGLTNLTTLNYSLLALTSSSSADVRPASSSRGRSFQQNFNLPSLQTLSLRVFYDICFIWPKGFLRGLDDLKVLSLQLCFCPFWPPDSETFSHTPHLLNLKIVKNVNWIPAPQVFQPLTVLQTLDLSDNQLKSVDFLPEANLTQLQTLILQRNDLSVLNERVFEALPSLRHLDLSENPFVCNCSNADFINWVIRNRQVYVNGAFQYRCVSPESVGFLCFICSSALVLLTLLSTFLHHFLRFHLLYGFYLLRALLYDRQQRRRGSAEIYDAFVSYNVHDEEWVYRELLPELEGRQGWKLCLHHRDFEPGKAIMENIVDAIYSSRKTLCVISHQYLLSEWCSREIKMARCCFSSYTFPHGSSCYYPFFRMRKQLRSRTYLSWSGARGHRGLFWERVRRALQSGAQLPTPPLRDV
uniref:TIR domain-containing protein n=1 Tax=Neogobius melanostomus TaxID=47308 RepID=A0A8C6UDV8_9GOBI